MSFIPLGLASIRGRTRPLRVLLIYPPSVYSHDAPIGTNRPVIVQYGSWLGHILSGNFGTSTQYQAPVGPLLGKAVIN